MVLKHVLIAVPTMAGLMKAKTATALVMTMRQLTRAGITAEYLNIDSAEITYARNVFAQTVLASKVLDGLLFVDSDMRFHPRAVMKLLRLETDVAAVAYPKRALDMDRFASAIANGAPYSADAKAKALARAYQFTLVPAWDNAATAQLAVSNGFAKMAAVGMGCALISKAALQAMIKAKVVERRKDILDGTEQVSWGFFDHVKLDDISLSEDFSFCYRWTKLMGRDLWVCIDEHVSHIGEFDYQARYLDRFDLAAPADARSEEAKQRALQLDAIELDTDFLR